MPPSTSFSPPFPPFSYGSLQEANLDDLITTPSVGCFVTLGIFVLSSD
jgi:hypothetical protein